MTRISSLFVASVLALTTPVMGVAQDTETLADIRQELSLLYVEVQRLKRELSTTGSPSASVGGNSPLERIDAIEAELQRLTANTEQLDFRVNQIATVGGNQIGDLEFRLCELEPNCDLADLGQGTTLGNVDVASTAPIPVPSSDTGVQLAVAEREDFDRAEDALSDGNYRGAAEQFAVYTETYPGGPLSARAHFLRGSALEQLGDTRSAARAYLDSFSSAPQGAEAPNALYQVGRSLADLGQTAEACQMFDQVGVRFPTADIAVEARSALQNLECS
ncbi:tol-pal system protein YbgF [Cochlodiniinecator piscidefendens]|uniref:tol-pal system protein YbgF n=1 Tax=Cochlodiniinecator piscidefendens TaxID=2715756 RepID=UPI00140854DE|nr:tol-pal system protein YbgF [Cochlodiniinecator piscidefendens]